MKSSTINFCCFPKTRKPPDFVETLVKIFKKNESIISTSDVKRKVSLKSNQVLSALSSDLINAGFEVERGKTRDKKIHRPVFWGENGVPILRYEIDAFHPIWKCGLEIEAARAILGNAIFRDLFQAMVMVEVDYLCIAVSNFYKYNTNLKETKSKDYTQTIAIADTLYSHTRMKMPFDLIIIGY